MKIGVVFLVCGAFRSVASALDSRKVNATWHKGRLTAKGREKLRKESDGREVNLVEPEAK